MISPHEFFVSSIFAILAADFVGPRALQAVAAIVPNRQPLRPAAQWRGLDVAVPTGNVGQGDLSFG